MRAGGDEEPGFLAQPLGGQRLQALDGRILLPDVVTDLGARHGLAHLRRRKRQRVGAEVDDVVHGDYLLRPSSARAGRARPNSGVAVLADRRREQLDAPPASLPS